MYVFISKVKEKFTDEMTGRSIKKHKVFLNAVDLQRQYCGTEKFSLHTKGKFAAFNAEAWICERKQKQSPNNCRVICDECSRRSINTLLAACRSSVGKMENALF